jgi:hypothetical protein
MLAGAFGMQNTPFCMQDVPECAAAGSSDNFQSRFCATTLDKTAS